MTHRANGLLDIKYETWPLPAVKTAAYVFPITAIVVFVQSITGAATVLSFLGFDTHMTTGVITGVFVLVSAITAFVVKPKYGALRYSSLVMLILVVLQGALGFSAETSDQLVVAHFVIALTLFGIAIAMVFYAFRWDRMGAAAAPTPT